MLVAPTVDNTYGMLYAAVVVSAVLYGVGIVQFWMYIRRYHAKDPLVVKSVVIIVLVCDIMQQGLLTYAVYQYLVTSMRTPAILQSLERSFLVELFFSCAIATLVQQFYCWRIYKITVENRFRFPLAGAVSILGFTTSALSYVFLIKAVKFSLLTDFVELRKLAIITNSFTAVTDITISVALIIVLHTVKTGYKKTTDMVNRLMVFTFNTGLPTSICAVLVIICVTAFSETFLYMFFFLLLGRLYTNSILVTLNCREYIKSSQNNFGQDLELSLNISVTSPIPASEVLVPSQFERSTMHDSDLKNSH
ncbi:hypothetical protein MVEN_02385100 [Mycena venus]|uniref:DUF6534 domain-containing protein n=1 Tax=Mycena venus TaxID=2733690 RepID=A0A8H7CF50_9AGAR|nr:hypothetical protein MVEN_02385100 [Mycena venus]